jgi:hypothetical protein
LTLRGYQTNFAGMARLSDHDVEMVIREAQTLLLQWDFRFESGEASTKLATEVRAVIDALTSALDEGHETFNATLQIAIDDCEAVLRRLAN